jgi:hypothetical protein
VHRQVATRQIARTKQQDQRTMLAIVGRMENRRLDGAATRVVELVLASRRLPRDQSKRVDGRVREERRQEQERLCGDARRVPEKDQRYEGKR